MAAKKLIWTHHIWDLGKPSRVVDHLKSMRADGVIIKMSDGDYSSYGETLSLRDLGKSTLDYVTAIRAAGIEVWGYHWATASRTVAREIASIAYAINRYAPEAYLLNVESPYDGLRVRAKLLLGGLPRPMRYGFCGARWPKAYCPKIPYDLFLAACDFVTPMVYWWGAHDAGEQMRRCFREYREIMTLAAISPRPFYPVLPAHWWIDAGVKRWRASLGEMDEAVRVADGEGAVGYSFFQLAHLLMSDMGDMRAWLTAFSTSSGRHVDNLTDAEFRSLLVASLKDPTRRMLDDGGFLT